MQEQRAPGRPSSRSSRSRSAWRAPPPPAEHAPGGFLPPARDALGALLTQQYEQQVRRAGFWIWGDQVDAHVPPLGSHAVKKKKATKTSSSTASPPAAPPAPAKS